ncbi:hypothetical protein Aph01nite_14210 [Acrocarpospora phusangensis]|uniref:DUF3040 domain-containing protein n=1 Tax=Acrocarpospora phusangensis TaxID=1070424 RepID=A0A919Q6L0_9ACTN|nr:DUF3040 domain-containing protein [Acrocarpospora phusangensis]GIH23111.1 hypothetical protein Aph01nite_14210 [Acrocarpospora phusangensis]
MGLSTRERRTLDDIARRTRAEDPALADRLSAHGTGAVHAEMLPSRPQAWPLITLAVLLAGCAFLYAISTPK